jgi:hypothetical protein
LKAFTQFPLENSAKAARRYGKTLLPFVPIGIGKFLVAKRSTSALDKPSAVFRQSEGIWMNECDRTKRAEVGT